MKYNINTIYKVTGIHLSTDGLNYIVPDYVLDDKFNEDSHNYYSGLDTLLVGVFKKSDAHPAPDQWSAIDWRISKIDAITLVDLDEKHPAGSSVGDILEIHSKFKNNLSFRMINDIKPGDIMLQDYFEYGGYETSAESLKKQSLELCRRGGTDVDFNNIEIHIYTAFGDHFIARSETKEQLENEKDNNIDN
ncbi:MAG: hypothetical protein K6E37_07045 [Bacteroidales bacterium]|nr:hypothetical protein [Bacteroidales bacterium]